MRETERARQHRNAIEHAARTGTAVRRFHFLCADGECFSAIAATESGAFRVLNAERVWMLAEFVETTHCPLDTRAARVLASSLTPHT